MKRRQEAGGALTGVPFTGVIFTGSQLTGYPFGWIGGEVGDWILETGFWDDAGSWIDTETWNDGV